MRASCPSCPHLPAHPAIFLVEPHGAFAFPASHFVDITAVEPEKRRLLSHHVSQEEAMRLAVHSGIGDLNDRLTVYRGEQAGCAHAEAFALDTSLGSGWCSCCQLPQLIGSECCFI